MPWMEGATAREKKISNRAIRLFMENWAATYESVREQLRAQGVPDVVAEKAMKLAGITPDKQ